ncbi:MAG: AmmeMemoRadiSam system radical SAM enzyme [Lachnospiraceae bacterium]|nr:AmmeMemoRadiSam system radical SAM enzyme [Lachnospiraceae bacterium]
MNRQNVVTDAPDGECISGSDSPDTDRAAVCDVCMHACTLRDGDTGVCRVRRNIEGVIKSVNYGSITSIALDPIEKKPLRHFHPGSPILSVGSFGCNLSCAFCQNHEISQHGGDSVRAYEYTPHELLEIAVRAAKEEGSIGLAYTYNEPLIGYEFVRDTARLIHEAGMLNVLVTNGEVNIKILEEILPYTDAMNIDLKGFRDDIYKRLGGDLDMVKSFIKRAVRDSHVEITSLIVPGYNDDPEDMRKEAEWIASVDPGIPLHITRYFPAFRYDAPPTGIGLIEKMVGVASAYLDNVYPGNV